MRIYPEKLVIPNISIKIYPIFIKHRIFNNNQSWANQVARSLISPDGI